MQPPAKTQRLVKHVDEVDATEEVLHGMGIEVPARGERAIASP
jgi:hypothetical protein